MECNRAIRSDDDILKNIQLILICILNLIQHFCNDKGFTFENIFREYIKPSVLKVYHPLLIKELKLNLDKEAYEKIGLLS